MFGTAQYAAAQAGARGVRLGVAALTSGSSTFPCPSSARGLLKGGISVGRVVALEVLERSTLAPRHLYRRPGAQGHGDAPGQRPPAAHRVRHAQEHAVRRRSSTAIARFAGRGYGHGVGLDQWRAKTMADLGYDASQILEYYYPGAALLLAALAADGPLELPGDGDVVGRFRAGRHARGRGDRRPGVSGGPAPGVQALGGLRPPRRSSARAPRSPSATPRAISSGATSSASSISRRSGSGPSSPRCSCSAPTTTPGR